jgi:predicted CXXCH cytochrome family protein
MIAVLLRLSVSLLLAGAFMVALVVLDGVEFGASHDGATWSSVSYRHVTAQGVGVFDRRLSGDKVGQHKVPPGTVVAMQVSVSNETGMTLTALADYFPSSWSVVDAGQGAVSTVDGARSKIEWDLGNVTAATTFSRDYTLLSPERTIPPTSYVFLTEFSHSEGSIVGDPWEVIVADPAPAPPSSPYAKGMTSTSIAVAWVPSDTTDISGYRVYRSGNGTDYAPIAALSGGQLVSSYVDMGLPASTLFYYKISAWRGTEEGNQTSVSTASTTAPGPPRGLRATHGNSSFVSLTWNSNAESNLVGYNVYRAISSNGAFARLTSSPVAATSYADIPPVWGMFYYYRVAAVDSTGAEGKTSAEVWARLYNDPAAGGPHAPYADTPDTCALCHRSHSGQSPRLLPATEMDLCLTCHDGTGSQYFVAQDFESPASEHPVTDGTLTCSSCHDPHLNWQDNPRLLDADGSHRGNAVCYTCHGQGDPNPPATDYETPFETGFHQPHISAPTTGTQIECSSCHKPHASTSGGLAVQKDENGCFPCHDGSTIGGDVLSGFTASVDARTHHDVFDADQAVQGTRIECTNCHNPHAAASASKVVDPEDPSPASLSLWAGTASAFCVVCHDGTLPTSTQTEPFAPAPQSPVLLPISGGIHVERYPCQACHDAHGTTNPFHLRSELYSEEQGTLREGLLVVTIADGEYDFRHFCNACHDPGHHGNAMSQPANCAASGCHVHGDRF